MLTIAVWSDVVCPWCFIGKRRFEAALATFPHASDVEVVFHAFELDPRAPRTSLAVGEYLATKYRRSAAQAQQMLDHVTAVAAGDGIAMRFDRARLGNTFDAHRLLQHAKTSGRQGALQERVMGAYFSEGAAIGERDVLAGLAGELGITDAADVLASDRYGSEVRADEALAQKLGISAVPFFVLGGQLGVSGAQPVEVLRRALERAWELRPADPTPEGAACTLDEPC